MTDHDRRWVRVRLSWQRLLTLIAAAPELGRLVDALGDKYALMPE